VTVEVQDHIAGLARRSIEGDPGALAKLLAELEPLVVRTVRLVVGSGSWAAEDAAQEALIDIVRGIGKVGCPEAVLSWTLRVATTRALKVARRERLLSLRRAPAIDTELLAETASEPAGERATALKDAFDRLTPRLRATAILRLQLALSEIESAEILGCSPQTVKSNLHRARTKLVKALRESGFGPSAIPADGKELS
jgi:RNA polymerase sigma-70 factor (ECF subfamily)